MTATMNVKCLINENKLQNNNSTDIIKCSPEYTVIPQLSPQICVGSPPHGVLHFAGPYRSYVSPQ